MRYDGYDTMQTTCVSGDSFYSFWKTHLFAHFDSIARKYIVLPSYMYVCVRALFKSNSSLLQFPHTLTKTPRKLIIATGIRLVSVSYIRQYLYADEIKARIGQKQRKKKKHEKKVKFIIVIIFFSLSRSASVLMLYANFLRTYSKNCALLFHMNISLWKRFLLPLMLRQRRYDASICYPWIQNTSESMAIQWIPNNATKNLWNKNMIEKICM